MAHPDENGPDARATGADHADHALRRIPAPELTALRAACDAHGLDLYLDGARLAQALTAAGNDLRPEDLPQLCDAFYIGGTKNGLLFGEAMVIVNDALKPGFRRAMKRSGAMLAKGRLLGVQFAAALEQDLWLDMGRHADQQAQRIAAALTDRNVPMYVPSPTNQIFPILPDAKIAQLQERAAFYTNTRVDETHQAVRFVTSWATTDAQVDALLALLPVFLDDPRWHGADLEDRKLRIRLAEPLAWEVLRLPELRDVDLGKAASRVEAAVRHEIWLFRQEREAARRP